MLADGRHLICLKVGNFNYTGQVRRLNMRSHCGDISPSTAMRTLLYCYGPDVLPATRPSVSKH